MENLNKLPFLNISKENFELMDDLLEKEQIGNVISAIYHYCYNGGLDIEEVQGNKLKNLPSWFYKTLDEIIKIHSSRPYELNAIIEKERIKNES